MSLRSVAQHAGVSVSTVSRYVRGELRVTGDTERRIRAAMDELGYHPPSRQIAPGRVALVIPDLSNPYFADLAQSVAQAGLARELETTIHLTGGISHREQGLVSAAVEDPTLLGVFYVGTNRYNPALRTAVGRKPLVVLDEPLEESDAEGIPFVGADNFSGSYQATSYLISLGHERIAHIGGPADSQSARHRLQGYCSALEAHGIDTDGELVFRGPYSEKFGASVLTYVTRLDPMPTALMVASDIAAVGIISAAAANGIAIPQDLSIVGFDGIGVGAWLRPKLTTVVQPIREITATGFAEILRICDGETGENHMLPMELQVRESTIGAAP